MKKYIKHGFKCREVQCNRRVGQLGNRCQSCAAKERNKIPENCSNYKHGKTSKYIKNGYNCINNCGNKVSRRGKICIPCFGKLLKYKHEKGIINFNGKNNPFYGKHHTKELRNNLRVKHLGRCWSKNTRLKILKIIKNRIHLQNCNCCICKYKRKEYNGKNNPRYINGLSTFPYSTEFNRDLKMEIRKRDGYQCQNCTMTREEHIKKFDEQLNIHHIDYNKPNNKKNNLITTCRPCNSRANSNRDYWYAFYTYIIIYKNYI